MKKFSLLTLLVLAAVFGTPAVIGIKAEARYQLAVERIQQSGLKVISHSFSRGWFGSTAETSFLLVSTDYSSAVSDSDRRHLSLRSTISHGPLVSTGLGLAEIDSEIKLGKRAIFPPDYPAEVHTLVDLNGSGATRVNLPPADVAGSAEMPDLSFGGMTGEMTFGEGSGDIGLQFVLQHLRIGSSGQKLAELGETRLESNSRTSLSGLMLGSGEFKVQRLMLHDAERSEQLIVDELAVSVDSAEETELVSAVASYRMQRIEVGGEVYGPGELRVELKQLSGPALGRLQQNIAQLKNQTMSDAQRSMALLSLMLELGSELLKNNPSITIKPLHLVTPDGTVAGEFSLRGDGLTMADISNIPALAGKLVADLSLRVPEKLLRSMLVQQVGKELERQIAALVAQGADAPELDQDQLHLLAEQQVDQQLNHWLSQQVIERDGADLATVASLSSGLLTVNGKTVPLPQ